jgi:hypothetical protein
MEIQRTAVDGRMRITDKNREVGAITGSRISFFGFSSPTEAAWAAWEAYRSLEFGRTGTLMDESTGTVSMELGNPPQVVVQGRGSIARLVPPGDPARRFEDWAFEMDLTPEDPLVISAAGLEVFLRGRARRMWRGIQRAGLHERAGQQDHRSLMKSKGEDHVGHIDAISLHARVAGDPAPA